MVISQVYRTMYTFNVKFEQKLDLNARKPKYKPEDKGLK